MLLTLTNTKPYSTALETVRKIEDLAQTKHTAQIIERIIYENKIDNPQAIIQALSGFHNSVVILDRELLEQVIQVFQKIA